MCRSVWIICQDHRCLVFSLVCSLLETSHSGLGPGRAPWEQSIASRRHPARDWERRAAALPRDQEAGAPSGVMNNAMPFATRRRGLRGLWSQCAHPPCCHPSQNQAGLSGRSLSPSPSAMRVVPRAFQTQLVGALAPPVRKQQRTEQKKGFTQGCTPFQFFTETQQTCLNFSFHLDARLVAFSVSREPLPSPQQVAQWSQAGVQSRRPGLPLWFCLCQMYKETVLSSTGF